MNNRSRFANLSKLAANVMDAGLVKNQSVFKEAYDMGYSV